MFIEALFIIANKLGEGEGLSVGEWINKLWNIHAKEYFPATEGTKFRCYNRMNYENMLSERNQSY